MIHLCKFPVKTLRFEAGEEILCANSGLHPIPPNKLVLRNSGEASWSILEGTESPMLLPPVSDVSMATIGALVGRGAAFGVSWSAMVVRCLKSTSGLS
jgi:hypothetical protein